MSRNIPFEMEEQIVLLLAKHTPFARPKIRAILEACGSVDITLNAMKLSCVYDGDAVSIARGLASGMVGSLFVVTAYLAGQRDNHCYVVGVFEAENEAKTQADQEALNRGGKYGCEVLRCRLNSRKEGAQVYYTSCSHQGDWGTGQDYITSNVTGEPRCS